MTERSSLLWTPPIRLDAMQRRLDHLTQRVGELEARVAQLQTFGQQMLNAMARFDALMDCMASAQQSLDERMTAHDRRAAGLLH